MYHTIQSDKITDRTKNEFKILIVDDDPAILRMIELYLKIDGYHSNTAPDGEEALKIISSDPTYDLLILDIMMPKVSGLDVCRTVRTTYTLFELPILIISALTDSKDVAAGLELGANDYIGKPINRIELLARVKSLLSLKQFYELARANERLAAHSTLYDGLTGLPNRSFLNNKLKEMIIEANREGTALAVLFLNINRFKSINNSLGHGVGDIYLRELSQRIMKFIPDSDIVVRLHTDTFAIVKTGLEKNGHIKKFCKEFARQLLHVVNQPIIIDQYELERTASIGISIYPHKACTIDDIIRFADSAMYYAKENRNDSIVFHSKNVHSKETKRFQLERKLKKALENKEFVLFYQPQIDLETGNMVGVEVLVRWNHPEEGIISPTKFIPIAEETGLIISLSEWILDTACKQNKLWQEMGFPPIRIGVNLSPQHFHNKNLYEHIEQVLNATKLNPRYLELEITEGTIMSNVEEAVKMLKKLKKMGIGISVDDFGTGYSSLNYLKRFPVNTIKIDQSFISRDISINRQDAAIVTSIIKLGHSLNLNVIAEGVETQEQLDYLRKNYCNEIQGFYYSKPLSNDKLTNLLNISGRNPPDWLKLNNR